MARRASVSSCDSKCSTCSSCSSFIDGHEQIGAYQLTKELSDGEFGQIRLGVNQNTHEKVAIKLMRKETVAAKMDKIQVEIDMLDHAHIVKLYEVVETESRIGIVLEYAAGMLSPFFFFFFFFVCLALTLLFFFFLNPGGELFDYVLDHGHVAEPQARLYFAQLIDSVRAMHELGIVHRDLKLENLLFKDVEQMHLMISDFGFANKGKDLFSTSCGSPCYAAPELVLAPGDYHGRAVDIWSCGVILYCMLCGCLPFDDDPDNPDGSNIRQLYHYIKTHTLSFPVEEQGAICLSEEAKDLLRRMLQPDPAARCTLNDVLHHSWLD
ncbi:kinase-like domain-containing protein, partial [Gongronella butleri]